MLKLVSLDFSHFFCFLKKIWILSFKFAPQCDSNSTNFKTPTGHQFFDRMHIFAPVPEANNRYASVREGGVTHFFKRGTDGFVSISCPPKRRRYLNFRVSSERDNRWKLENCFKFFHCVEMGGEKVIVPALKQVRMCQPGVAIAGCPFSNPRVTQYVT